MAERIRALLLDKRNSSLRAGAELLLFEAARIQHLAETIVPALAKGAVVLCDRFADSTTAYQGAGRALSRPAVAWLNRFACGGVWPGLTLVFDLPVAEGLKRARRSKGRADRMESAARGFHERVRAEFLRLARREPGRVRLLKVAGKSEAEVRALVWQALLPRLRRAGHAL
jgi:dTMP kinase